MLDGRSLKCATAAVLLVLALGVHAAAAQVMRAQDFVDSIGVNLHVPYTDGGYVNGREVLRALNYLGVRYVRDHPIKPQMQPESIQNFNLLAASGISFAMMVNGGNIEKTLAHISDFAHKYPGALHAIEGPNEVNNWPVKHEGKTGTAAAVSFQAALYDAVKADPVLKDLPVYNYTNWPYTVGKADFANIHPYAKNGSQPFAVLQKELSYLTPLMPGTPVVITETGYYTLPKPGVGWGGVDQPTQAKFMVNLLLDAALIGVRRTYIYQLLDAYPDYLGKDQERHFGLFDLTYRPKPAATAIRRLTRLLRDESPAARSFAPRPSGAAVTGLMAQTKTLQMQKADGTTVLAIWTEPDIWDEKTAQPLQAPVQSLTVRLAEPRAHIAAFSPVSGDGPIAQAENSRALTISQSDEAILVVISPR